ncbi:MAG: DUF4174 domain-containing protein [Planctomycetota bacterium]
MNLNTTTSRNSAAVDRLNALHWSSRVALVFSPSEDDPRYWETLAAIERVATEFAERDMVLLSIFGDQRSLNSDRIRQRFDVRSHEFVAVLIGKDGGEKNRRDRLSDLSEWFDQIDGMPMRRAEMRRRN